MDNFPIPDFNQMSNMWNPNPNQSMQMPPNQAFPQNAPPPAYQAPFNYSITNFSQPPMPQNLQMSQPPMPNGFPAPNMNSSQTQQFPPNQPPAFNNSSVQQSQELNFPILYQIPNLEQPPQDQQMNFGYPVQSQPITVIPINNNQQSQFQNQNIPQVKITPQDRFSHAFPGSDRLMESELYNSGVATSTAAPNVNTSFKATETSVANTTVNYGANQGSSAVIATDSKLNNFSNILDSTKQIPTDPQILASKIASGEAKIVETRKGTPLLIDVIEKQERIINETITKGNTRVIGEREMKRERKSETRQMKKEELIMENIKRDKIVEIIKEKLIPVETTVDVKYDVIVDVPVERIFERQKIHEVTVERPVEKTIQVNVEQIYEIPVEKIIERPVQITKTVQVPRERIVQVQQPFYRENIISRDRIIDIDERMIGQYPGAAVMPTIVDRRQQTRVVEMPVVFENWMQRDVQVIRPHYIEVPRERVVQMRRQYIHERPVPVERQYIHETIVPVVNNIVQHTERIVEKPVYRERLIEKPVMRERIVEKEVQVPVERLIEKPIIKENLITRQVEKTVEVPVPREVINEVNRDVVNEVKVNVERVREIPVEKVVKKPVANIRTVEVPFEVQIEKLVHKDVEHIIEKKIPRVKEKPVEKVIEKKVKVERLIEKPKVVEKVVEVPVHRTVENIKTVEKVREKPRHYNSICEQVVENIVIKDVEVPVEKIKEVEVKIIVEKAVLKETIYEEEIILEAHSDHYDENLAQEELFEHEDEELGHLIQLKEKELNEQMRENKVLKSDYQSLLSDLQHVNQGSFHHEESENWKLKSKLQELDSRLRYMTDLQHRLQHKSSSRTIYTETVINKDPRVETLKSRLRSLISENNHLADEILRTGEQLKQSLKYRQSHRHTNNYNHQNNSYGSGQTIHASMDFNKSSYTQATAADSNRYVSAESSNFNEDFSRSYKVSDSNVNFGEHSITQSLTSRQHSTRRIVL